MLIFLLYNLVTSNICYTFVSQEQNKQTLKPYGITVKPQDMREILINTIVRETEKAILVLLPVTWNDKMYPREIWMPKSVTGKRGEHSLEVKGWFLDKQSDSNVFHGYKMTFEFFE